MSRSGRGPARCCRGRARPGALLATVAGDSEDLQVAAAAAADGFKFRFVPRHWRQGPGAAGPGVTVGGCDEDEDGVLVCQSVPGSPEPG